MNRYTVLIILFCIGFIVSGIKPLDYFTWKLEVLPAILGFIVLLYTYKSFRFSNVTYYTILIHCYILFIGGHYTYAEVPFFNWIQDAFHHTRNNYDKVGHFAQGFVPTLISRELFIRKKIVQDKLWLPILTICISLSVSALYELGEWMVAIISKQDAEAFLGTQGYAWDTQSDMFYAFLGSISMLIFATSIQNKSITNVESKNVHVTTPLS
ncbi:MAG: DUF2238 domain-containing protein [Saprospiraceae bacterium]|nr:DUF2238 domain-containing protein [Saprospiraceae bacterium]MBK8450060.1 DUF2238 domain-containing protein [Saprospiraceae bacterium]MBK8483892.1 DUF2238 domain-containing protein [Saprospiraceae bacterium]MBK9221298.1 DUF2238 domain-containing protein [Saprospiraceae bacterium]MBK9721767.1 DUF2238 domain-containing protein [Saprospiraceae bacterium]